MTTSGAVWGSARRRLLARPDDLMVPALAAGLAWIVLLVLLRMLLDATVTRSVTCVRRLGELVETTRCAPDQGAMTASTIVMTFAFCVLGLLFWAVVVRAADRQGGSGRAPAPLSGRVLGSVVATALLLGAALTLGIGLGFLPALPIAVLGQFAVLHALRGQGPGTALAASARSAIRRPGPTLAFTLTAAAVLAVGAGFLLVGLWPAAALVAAAQVRFVGPHPPKSLGPHDPDGVPDGSMGTMSR